ncbi:DUF4173 domain-containing protein [Virgibacillus sp. AGTR]|uniref:DUF4173 domain-containing protein n=1 Tax=Virgibacillus salarius TaxID=447199 RepID=A0A941I988_9BACI|nr:MULTISPECIES: DUF4173 domain-containing protein [Virgibacillus]NAZ09213.1 DUF4173 domain-containing protein [Agaribacter marinus]MBR7796504.1 DUF4173 domain-containing protein [Virgibacillus salarius]MCC2252498.1 DUF4173 domain-containing protein [Virgibacillus sp. AGTR]MDY7043744.1 DUF4173 domain-containing protein [Virgibacillus sp. M23]QRZ19408.1 DUF4173 domain-containing protein [Virgibacillus sp. AGTR]
MVNQINLRGVWLLLVSLGLGIVAEVCFFHGKIGISYIVFIVALYMVIFLHFQFAFYHRRIGMLLMVVIWLLAGSYLYLDSILFYEINLVVIPLLIYCHLVLITTPDQYAWVSIEFVTILKEKCSQSVRYSLNACDELFKRVFKYNNKDMVIPIKPILIGLGIGIPLLLIVITLLMSADKVFQELVLRVPNFIMQMNLLKEFWRIAIVLLVAFFFFGLFRVLPKKPSTREGITGPQEKNWNGLTAVTILLMLLSVYLLFVCIQFSYFFGESLHSGYTFAEYARKGFFELIIVTLINWSILISFMRFVQNTSVKLNRMLKILYTLLIGLTSIMLISAYQRLSMYEEAYGYTLDRVLAHGFMIFLMVIFAYTLIRVWLTRLSLLHFYLIAGMIFYTGMNVINIEKLVTDKNLERYEETGKIDIYYLNTLSYSGWNGLLQLYTKEPNYHGLEELLIGRINQVQRNTEKSWQSFNFTRQKIEDKLDNLYVD